jgi:peptide/nickel transport system substrate-binding protein
LAGAFVVFLLITPVSPSSAQAVQQVLRIGFDAGDLSTLDPHMASATMDRAVADMVFNALLRFKPGDISVIEPDLAKSFEVSRDGMALTFTLRQGVRCHPYPGAPDGYELTSDDVVYSINKAATPATSAYAGDMAPLSATAVDKYTVRVTLKRRVPGPERLLTNYSGGFIICKQAAEALGSRFKTQPVGTGPFMFNQYVPGQKTVLVRNDRYFRGKPVLDRVEVWYMADLSSREFGLQRGELDAIEGRSEQPWVEKMRKVPGTVVDVFGPGEATVLHLNMTKEPLNRLKVRQAIAYSLSRRELVTFLGPAVATPIYGPVPAELPGGLTQKEVDDAGLAYATNRDYARQLLREAGLSGGLALDVLISERGQYRSPMENVQAQLRTVGINVNLNVIDHASFHARIRQDLSPIVLYVAMRPSTDAFLTQFYHSDATVSIGKAPITNFSHYSRVDRQIERAREATDPQEQIRLWKEAELKILEDAAAIPLVVSRFVFARKPSVDWGHRLKSVLALYPQIDETTKIVGK